MAPSADWTMFGIRSSTEVFDSTWAIFADRVMQSDAGEIGSQRW